MLEHLQHHTRMIASLFVLPLAVSLRLSLLLALHKCLNTFVSGNLANNLDALKAALLTELEFYLQQLNILQIVSNVISSSSSLVVIHCE